MQAALVSAGGFLAGGLPSVLIAAMVPASLTHPGDRRGCALPHSSAWSARLGAAPTGRAALQVTLIGGVAMASRRMIGNVLGTAV
jgi:hypothetical protein